MAIGFEGYSCGIALRRKRVLVVNNDVEATPRASDHHDVMMTPSLKRVCSGTYNFNSDKSPLEALPLDVLIRVLCYVDHEDLEQLGHVSKTVREATEIAKRLHFEYTTPKKQTFHFRCRSLFDFDDENGFDEIETPKAPMGKTTKSRLNGGNLASISVALFASMDDEEKG